MSVRYKKTRELYEITLARIISDRNEWSKFLEFQSRLYKHRFEDVVLIYAQRPNAQFIADMNTWNTKVGRWIKKGSTSIAVFDREKGYPNLKNLFEISDTKVSKKNQLSNPIHWKIDKNNQRELLYECSKEYDINTINEYLKVVVTVELEKYESQIYRDFEKDIEGSQLSKFELENVKAQFKNTLKESIYYLTATRCGLDVKSDFKTVSFYNTNNLIFRLGDVISGISKNILRDVESKIKYIEKQNSERSKKNVKSNGVQRGNGKRADIQGADTRSRGESGDRKIRIESVDLFRGNSAAENSTAKSRGNIATQNGSDKPEGKQSLSGNSKSDDDNIIARPTPRQSKAARTYTEPSRGNSIARSNEPDLTGSFFCLKEIETNKRIRYFNVSDNSLKERFDNPVDFVREATGDDSLILNHNGLTYAFDKTLNKDITFNSNDYPNINGSFVVTKFYDGVLEDLTHDNIQNFKKATNIGYVDLSKISDEDLLTEILLKGSGTANGKKRIADYLSSDHSFKEKEIFLKDEYGTGGGTFSYNVNENLSDRIGSSSHDSKGISLRINDGREIKLTWSKVANELEILIQSGNYFKKRYEIEKNIPTDNKSIYNELFIKILLQGNLSKTGKEDIYKSADNENFEKSIKNIYGEFWSEVKYDNKTIKWHISDEGLDVFPSGFDGEKVSYNWNEIVTGIADLIVNGEYIETKTLEKLKKEEPKLEKTKEQQINMFDLINNSNEVKEKPKIQEEPQIKEKPKIKQPNTQPHKNYKKLEQIARGIVDNRYSYLKLKSKDFMDLNLEHLYDNRFSITYYYMENGDMMSDPDMEVIIDTENKTIMPATFQQDNIGLYQEVYKDGKWSPKLSKDLSKFLNDWFTNIKAQGHMPFEGHLKEYNDHTVTFDDEGYEEINDEEMFEMMANEGAIFPKYNSNEDVVYASSIKNVKEYKDEQEDLIGDFNIPDEVEYMNGYLEDEDVNDKKESSEIKSVDNTPFPLKIVESIMPYLENGEKLSWSKLFEITDNAYSGTQAEGKYTVKDAYDCLELSVNKWIEKYMQNANGDKIEAVNNIKKLETILDNIPTQTKRTEEMEDYQQFSTPPNISYIANWVANIDNDDIALEPSAGIGGLATFSKLFGADVYVNELSTRRADILKHMEFKEVFIENAEHINDVLPKYVKPTVIIMNPPFSSTAGRLKRNTAENGKKHLMESLKRLEKGGRLVAILGNNMADDKAHKNWWNTLKKEYNVRANITIDGKNYKKYGTTYDVQIVVIDKTEIQKDSETITGTFTELYKIPKVLEPIRNDRKRDFEEGKEKVKETEEENSKEIVELNVESINAENTSLDINSVDDVYTTYKAKKIKVEGSHDHPSMLVESSAMGTVTLPNVSYKPKLSAGLVTDGKLSIAQLENVIYAGQAHSKMLATGERKGYFIGDGTGVGKGRQVSGVILDNYNKGRKKAIWISKNTSLYDDAVRDWVDIGGKKEDIKLINKFTAEDTLDFKEGILFASYDTLRGGSRNDITKTRLDQIINWFGKDYGGVIVFDESHNMANSLSKKSERGIGKPSQKALKGIELQERLPNARILYASATGATEISHYAYLTRLGLWGEGTAFSDVFDFIGKVSRGGIAAMELVARDMKSMGVYNARNISYKGIAYETLTHNISPVQRDIYDTVAGAWQKVFKEVDLALALTGADKNGRAKGAARSILYSGMQRFFNQVITSMSMPTVIEDMRKELNNDNSIVIQLVNTNEAASERAISRLEDDDLDNIDLTPTEDLIMYVRRAFPVNKYEEYYDEKDNIQSRIVLDSYDNPVISKEAEIMRDDLIENLQDISVPDGPLEYILNEFGYKNVSEITGRSRRVVMENDLSGNEKKIIQNITPSMVKADVKSFQDGDKRILIFSNAGGTGKSYHADRRAKNQQRRIHYLLQPGWNAAIATQGFGRTHRSNQVCEPKFKLVTTDIMGQKRFTATIAKRLDQLGALTKGSSKTENNMFTEDDNLDNPIARDALSGFYSYLAYSDINGTDGEEVIRKMGLGDKLFNENGEYRENENVIYNIPLFLNRILTLEVDIQNTVFNKFLEAKQKAYLKAVEGGRIYKGLENFMADKMEVMDTQVLTEYEGGAKAEYVKLMAYTKPDIIEPEDLQEYKENFRGIVIDENKIRASYQIASKTNSKGEIVKRYHLQSPIKGIYSIYEESNYDKTIKVNEKDYISHWEKAIDDAPEYKKDIFHMLTGTLLPIWDKLPSDNARVMRVVADDGNSYLGRIIPKGEIHNVFNTLLGDREDIEPEDAYKRILEDGEIARLSYHKQEIKKARVSGEYRLELTGGNLGASSRINKFIIVEKIAGNKRYFIPTALEDFKVYIMTNNLKDMMYEADIEEDLEI